MTSALCILGVLAFLAGTPTSAWAQSGTASLNGEVTDAQKQVVPGALVTVTNTQTGTAQTVVTDEPRHVPFRRTAAGSLPHQCELTGFKTSIAENVPLPVDVTTRQNLVLELGGAR